MATEQNKEVVYLALGSNIGDSYSILKNAMKAISEIPHVHDVTTSCFYQTTPVSSIPQRDFLNAACVLQTTLCPESLYEALHRIEISLGKISKAKDAPRPIDIDILFFGMRFQRSPLCIPHPRWKGRLFVLKPLSDLVSSITFPIDEEGNAQTVHLQEFLQTFPNPHNEYVNCMAAPLKK